jgi:hypothetical protein
LEELTAPPLVKGRTVGHLDGGPQSPVLGVEHQAYPGERHAKAGQNNGEKVQRAHLAVHHRFEYQEPERSKAADDGEAGGEDDVAITSVGGFGLGPVHAQPSKMAIP